MTITTLQNALSYTTHISSLETRLSSFISFHFLFQNLNTLLSVHCDDAIECVYIEFAEIEDRFHFDRVTKSHTYTKVRNESLMQSYVEGDEHKRAFVEPSMQLRFELLEHDVNSHIQHQVFPVRANSACSSLQAIRLSILSVNFEQIYAQRTAMEEARLESKGGFLVTIHVCLPSLSILSACGARQTPRCFVPGHHRAYQTGAQALLSEHDAMGDTD